MCTKGRILWDVILMGLIAVLSCFLPFSSYVYKNIRLSIGGFDYLTGIQIAGGKVTISPTLWILAILILMAAVVMLALLFPKIKKVQYSGFLLLILSCLALVFCGIFLSGIKEALKRTGSPKIEYGIFILTGIILLMILRSFHILYRENVISVLHFMVIPGMIYFLVNNYFPMLGMFIAFKDIDFSKGIWASDWVGLKNFEYLFATGDAWIMIRNTVLYNLCFIVLGTMMGVTAGIMLNEVIFKKLKKFYQTSILLPQLISIIIIAYIVYAFLSNESGLINGLLGDGNEINFYNTRIYWPFILVFVYIWKSVGYSSIIYLSSIVGIDNSLFEAARVDGANKMKQIFLITIPLIRPTIITMVLLNVGKIFYSDFGLFLQVPMNSGSLFSVTQTIDTYVYRSLLTLNDIALSSAASVFQSIVGFAVVLLANGIVRKVDRENALF